MCKRMLMAALLLTTALSVTACGKETETSADESVESTESEPAETEEQDSTEEESQPVEAEEQDAAEEESQPAEEDEEEASYSYIFSDMPVAAYEVTGLGVGRSESVYNEHYFDANGTDYGIIPMIRLTPGENTFVLFCMEGDEDGEYSVSASTIHSSSGGKWDAITYTCIDALIDPAPEGYSILTRQETDNYAYDEDTYNGSFFSLVDPWWEWLRFAEIYHSDAPQEDAIYAIDLTLSLGDEEYDEMDEVLAGMVNAFNVLGGTLEEIPVEEALERCNIEVSQ